MGPEAAVNAVYANKIQEIEDADERKAFIREKENEYREAIDIYRVASELIVDEIVPANGLRRVLAERLQFYESKNIAFSERKNPVYPV